MKKKYVEPEMEVLEALFTEDVLYASTGEDNVDDVGNTTPPDNNEDLGSIDIPSAEIPDKEIGGGEDWGSWW